MATPPTRACWSSGAFVRGLLARRGCPDDKALALSTVVSALTTEDRAQPASCGLERSERSSSSDHDDSDPAAVREDEVLLPLGDAELHPGGPVLNVPLLPFSTVSIENLPVCVFPLQMNVLRWLSSQPADPLLEPSSRERTIVTRLVCIRESR